jgi:5'-methylthioadenosine phosphorylase
VGGRSFPDTRYTPSRRTIRMLPVGVLTGTGVTEQFDLSRQRTVRTRFGEATVFGSKGGEYFVIPRHGAAHKSPPHAINYRANIAAFERLGVREIIATSAVGSMNLGFKVGEMGLVEQFLDFTKRRRSTFFENRVVHTDMTYPYSRRLNLELAAAAKRMGVEVKPHLVYVCAEGPRFETAAEIKMYKLLGGDVVGMTGVPEVVLANEMKLEYASVVIATNWAAGMQPRVSHEEVLRVMKRSGKVVKQLIESTVAGLRREKR